MATKTPERIHYGDLQYPKAPGLGQFDRRTGLFFIGIIAAVFLVSAYTASLPVIIVGITTVGLFCYLTYQRDAHGFSVWDRLNERLYHAHRKATGRNVYVSDLLTKDTTNLPGLMACTRLTEHDGPLGRFALIHHQSGQTTLVMTCEPTGGSLHDQEAVDLMVGRWGLFGAQFAQSNGVDQYAVTLETGPNFGASAIAEVQTNMDPDANDLARQINLDTTRMGAEARATFAAYVSITYKATQRAKGHTREQHDAQTAERIARGIKHLATGLQEAGGGIALPATTQDLTHAVRAAYDPWAAALIEDATARGEAVEIDWETAGPTRAEAHIDSYAHDDHHSVTFKMTNAIRGSYHETILSQLIDSHPAIDRKRVTIVKHPVAAATARNQVEVDYQDAKLAANEPKARGEAALNLETAYAVREAVNLGAALEKFTMFVTVTVADEDRLADAVAAVEQQLAPSARLDLRIVRGRQDTAFVAALPLGLDLATYRREPLTTRIRRYFS